MMKTFISVIDFGKTEKLCTSSPGKNLKFVFALERRKWIKNIFSRKE